MKRSHCCAFVALGCGDWRKVYQNGGPPACRSKSGTDERQLKPDIKAGADIWKCRIRPQRAVLNLAKMLPAIMTSNGAVGGSLYPGYVIRCHNSKNVRTLRILAEKVRIKAACHNFGTCEPNKARKKYIVESRRWLPPAECLESASGDELKKPQLAPEGRFLDAIRKVERVRCLRAVSQTAPGRLRTLPLRHYGRGARSSLVKGVCGGASCGRFR
jgi:hypothetical protein